ncbi:MAG: hypothetical protein IKN74_06515 [Clostridia bacterium]|nr:hypothetical protein [Clostridia bacterium]
MRKLLYIFLIIFIVVALVLGIKASKGGSFVPSFKDYDYMTVEGPLDNPEQYPLLQKDNLSVSAINILTKPITEEDLKDLNLTEEERNNTIIQADNDNFIVLVKFKTLDATPINELSCDFQIYDITGDTCNIYLTSITQVKNDLIDAFSNYLNINSGNSTEKETDKDTSIEYKYNRIGTSYKRFIVKQEADYVIVLFSTQIPDENIDLVNTSALNVLIINPQYQNDSGEKIELKNTFFNLIINK